MENQLQFNLLGFISVFLAFSFSTWAQTSPILETFENLGPYNGYFTETWTGDQGGTWTATDARTDLTINGKAITVRDGSLTSPTVLGGIGDLTVTTQRKYGSGSGVVDVKVNGNLVGTVPYGDAAETTVIPNINVAGSIIVEFITPGNGARVAFDDLQWTASASSSSIVTALPSSLSNFDYDLGEGPSASQSFDVSGNNLVPEAGNITIAATTNFEISTDNVTFGSTVTLPYTTGSLLSNTIYVRLIASLSEGVYSEQITISGGGAPNSTVDVEGTVSLPIDAPSLIISEIADPSDNSDARFVEVYNNGTSAIDFGVTTVYLARYSNDNIEASSVQLTGTLAAGEFYIIADNAVDFTAAYGLSADLTSGIVNVNGDDTFTLFVGGDWSEGGTLFDIYGEIGTDGSGEAWEYKNSRAVRNDLSVSPSETWTASEWTITTAGVADMTPGTGEEIPTATDYIFDGVTWTPTNPNGVITSNDNVIIQAGTGVFTENLELNNLNIASGAALNVDKVLTINGDVVNDGSIVFVSSDTAQGQLAPILAGVTFSGEGDVVSERHIPVRADGKGAYRFLTSPVQSDFSIHMNWQVNASGMDDNPMPNYGMFITGSSTGANGFDATPSGAPSMFNFNLASQQYDPIANTDIQTLQQGHPYLAYVWGDRSLDIIGPNPGDNDPDATPTTLLSHGNLIPADYTNNSLSEIANGFSLIGNPYQAIVDMNSVLTTATNINPNHYYVWDPNIGTRGGFATVSLPIGSNPQNSDANQFLQVGQAVFLSTLADGPASITFSQDDKAVFETPTDVFRPTVNENAAFINVKLFTSEAYATGKSLSDAFQINFSEAGNNAILLNDALKLQNFDENIGVSHENQVFSIENRAIPEDGESISLFANQFQTTAYVFKIASEGFPENTQVFLVDNFLNLQTPLTENGETLVDFSIDSSIPASIASDRFSLLFERNSLSTNDFSSSGLVVYPNPVKSETLFIANLQSGKTQINFFNILGQEVLNMEKVISTTGKISINVSNLQPGLFIVTILQNGSTKITKIRVE